MTTNADARRTVQPRWRDRTARPDVAHAAGGSATTVRAMAPALGCATRAQVSGQHHSWCARAGQSSRQSRGAPLCHVLRSARESRSLGRASVLTNDHFSSLFTTAPTHHSSIPMVPTSRVDTFVTARWHHHMMKINRVEFERTRRRCSREGPDRHCGAAEAACGAAHRQSGLDSAAPSPRPLPWPAGWATSRCTA